MTSFGFWTGKSFFFSDFFAFFLPFFLHFPRKKMPKKSRKKVDLPAQKSKKISFDEQINFFSIFFFRCFFLHFPLFFWKNAKKVEKNLLIKLDFSTSGRANQLFSTFFFPTFFAFFRGKCKKHRKKEKKLICSSKLFFSTSGRANQLFFDFFFAFFPRKMQKKWQKHIKNSRKSRKKVDLPVQNPEAERSQFLSNHQIPSRKSTFFRLFWTGKSTFFFLTFFFSTLS